MTEDVLRRIRIDKPDEEARKRVKTRWDSVAKPLDSMGRFEELLVRIGGITGTDKIAVSSRAVVIMCSDNGIVEEGISQSGQEVTALVAESMARGESSVCRMAKVAGCDIKAVDIGINADMTGIALIHKKTAWGTKNFLKEPAMTRQEALQAIGTGIEIAVECKREGYDILAMGEMGIGNTTTSSAVAAALTACPVSKITGRGAGLGREGLERKISVITRALEQYKLTGADPLRILAAVGGFDLAGMAGLCIGGAVTHIPVVLDGAISVTAALIAERLVPGVGEYLIPSHKSREPAAEYICGMLGLQPVIDGEMALGEGTGAVMMLSLLDMAAAVYDSSASFQDIGVERYVRF